MSMLVWIPKISTGHKHGHVGLNNCHPIYSQQSQALLTKLSGNITDNGVTVFCRSLGV